LRVRFVISNPNARTLMTSTAKNALLPAGSMPPHHFPKVVSSGVLKNDLIFAARVSGLAEPLLRELREARHFALGRLNPNIVSKWSSSTRVPATCSRIEHFG